MTIWPREALVRHNKGLFRAIEKQNTAIPGDVYHARFYVRFSSNSSLISKTKLLNLCTVNPLLRPGRFF